MGPHAGFIVAAYAITVLVLGGTFAAVLLDGARQRHALRRLAGQAPAGRAGAGEDRDVQS